MRHLSTLATLLLATAAACGDDSSAAPDSMPPPDMAPAQPDLLALPGNAYYPESLSADANGTLYVGSLTTGQVVAFEDGKTDGKVVVGAGSGVTGVAGVNVHGNELVICSIDTTFQRPTEVRTFALDGTPHATLTLGANRFCNDTAYDAAGNLYATDSFSGTVLRSAGGTAPLTPWLTDASLAPAAQGAFGLDGIVAVQGAIIVNKLDTSGLYRIPVNADGTAGTAQAIAVTPPLASPDGMRALDDHTLLIIESGGQLVKVTLDASGTTGTATTLKDGLDQPTGVVVARGSAWVSEGQLGRLFAMPPQSPHLPFAVVRVPL